jgi:hypothetical protein
MSLSSASLLTFFTVYVLAFIVIFIITMGEANIRTGKTPTLPDGVMKWVVLKIITVAGVLSVANAILSHEALNTQKVTVIDASNTDMTVYWVVVAITLVATPILTAPLFWVTYWCITGVYMLYKSVSDGFASAVAWWGGLFFKNEHSDVKNHTCERHQ